jgi:DNA-binding HxlR family transcriptional regulator
MIINEEEYYFRINEREFHCALDVTMGYIGGKWKSIVLWYLRKNTKRFKDLKKDIPQITEKMLSLQLKELEQDGIVTRTVFAEVPPRVEYELTNHGKTLIPMLEEMAKWGRDKGEKEGQLLKR